MSSAPETTRPPIALRTIFTPPASCLDTVTYDGTSAWQNGIRQTGDPNCYPASFNNIYNSWYSPGICPMQWTEAQTIVGSSPVTVAFCCPSNYTLYTTTAKVLLANYCYSSLATPITNVASVAALTTGPLPATATLVTLQPSKAANSLVYADVIQIHYQSSNGIVVSLMSSTAAASARLATATTTMPPATSVAGGTVSGGPNPDVSGSDASGGGLSGGAKAGIGVGVALVVIALVGVAAFFFLRRRRGRRQHLNQNASVDHGGGTEEPISGEGQAQDGRLAEMDAPAEKKLAEMYTHQDPKHDESDALMGTKAAKQDTPVDSTRPAEMDARQTSEMPASGMVAELGNR